ncbi:amine oxidase [Pyrenochaeta sp. DS3sAY3a]|nr:amine oxidase [Pyrenochaeta sp. DS3sAY3a]
MAQTAPTSAQVLVIGGGMSGLTAAHNLQSKGVNVIVLEAASRFGGRIESVTTSLGSRIDLGGQWVGHDHHRLRKLAAKAGATVYKVYSDGNPIMVYKGKKLPIYSPGILLSGILLVFFDLLCRVFIPRSWNSVSTQDAIALVGPTKLTRTFLDALTTLSFCADTAKTSIYALAKSVPLCGGLTLMMSTHGGAQDSMIVESIGAVVDMLVGEIGKENMQTGMRVVRIEQDQEKGGKVTIRTASGEVLIADKVIVTIPPPMLKSIEFEPQLPEEMNRVQQNTEMGIVYKAIAVYDKPFWRSCLGGEILLLDDPACGVCDTSAPDGPGHLTFLVGGTPTRALDDLDSTTRRELLLSRLALFLGKEVLHPVDWHEKAWHQDEFVGGGYAAMPVGCADVPLPMPSTPVQNIFWAGTETTSKKPGYIEGAIESGERVAGEVISAFRS